MSRNQQDLDKLLDRIVDQIRDDAPEPAAAKAIGDRVWERVRTEAERQAQQSPAQRQIRDCADFQALIPAYLQGALSEGRALLLEDHLRECVPCRRALKAARSGRKAEQVAQRTEGSTWISRVGWRAAAAAVIFLAVAGLSVNTGVLKVRSGGVIHVEAIEGELFKVTPNGAVPVRAGEQVSLNRGEALRTAKGTRAMIRLRDESAVEMKERSELGVFDQAWLWNRKDKDAVLALERGSVIVEASDQGSGHLFVKTDDSTTSVTGTVFAVNHGIKGTRVSVIEGEVHVDYNRAKEVLHPGQQATTQPGLDKVPVASEIAWSANLEKHLQLLRDVTELGREIDRVLAPELRYSTDLLDQVPSDTVIYIGIPNVTGGLDEAQQILAAKIASSPALREWWQTNVVEVGFEAELHELIDRVQAYGDRVGEEVVVAMRLNGESDDVEQPLILARVDDPQALRAMVEEDMAKSAVPEPRNLVVIEGDRPDLSGIDGDAFLWLTGDLMAFAFDREPIQHLAAERLAGVPARSKGTMLSKLEDRYRDGVEWVVGVDMERILAGSTKTKQDEAEMRGFGFLDMQHLIGERRGSGERTENRVVLSFSRQRRGIAAWLDEPAPMGSLDFVSPNATLAAGFVMQQPSSLVDELFQTIGGLDDSFEAQLAEFEAEHGISVRDDIAAPLGGEFAFALDGPVLPVPAWKMIVEVYNPEQLQQTLEWAVGEINAAAGDAGYAGIELSTESANGRDYHKLMSTMTGISVTYTFVDGYMLVGPNRALIDSAIQTRDSGVTLAASEEFVSLLPRDAQMNFSGVVYQNFGTLLGPLARLGGATAKLSPEAQQFADELSRNSKPSMTTAYGAGDSITFVYTHEGGFISSGLSSFFSFQSLTGVQELIGQSLRQ